MGLWDRVTRALAMEPWDHPELVELSTPIEEELWASRAHRQAQARPWRAASIKEALGVPAIWSAVSLAANVSATLTLRGYRNGSPVPPDDRRPLTIRPNPFTTTRQFVQETVYSMASRGEAWWWVAKRDGDGNAISLVPVPAYEVQVDSTTGDWLRPHVEWRGKTDLVQIPYVKEAGELRGKGPLQMCGAAISVAVEAQEWAANFFADGGRPSTELHSDDPLTADEARELREQWVETPPNMPQVTSGPLTVKQHDTDVPAAQMLDARNMTRGEVAVLFHMPGSILEYSREGSDLTYQNITQEFDKLLRQCLLPDYLEPIEQALSDLLPRSWSTRFNADALLRADIKTRYEVYKLGVSDSGILDRDEARAMEGLEAGDIEVAPVPPAPPQAIPAGIPVQLGLRDIRCKTCKRLLGRAEGAAELRCSHCKTVQLTAA